MSRHLLCPECLERYLPEGTRQIEHKEKSMLFLKYRQPAEYQRLVVGIAKQPTQDQRYIQVNDERTDLSTDFYECDFCSKEIYPREKCAALSIWTEETPQEPQWEHEYLLKVVDGLNRSER